MDQKAYVPPMPAYSDNPQIQQGAYPHLPPPPSYDSQAYQGAPTDSGANAPYPPQHHHQPIPVQPTVVHTVYQQVGPDPTNLTCPSCRQVIQTTLDYETSTKTHIVAGILCAFICWPFAWLPYVMNSCKNANHYCPNCGAFVGTYKN